MKDIEIAEKIARDGCAGKDWPKDMQYHDRGLKCELCPLAKDCKAWQNDFDEKPLARAYLEIHRPKRKRAKVRYRVLPNSDVRNCDVLAVSGDTYCIARSRSAAKRIAAALNREGER